MRERKYRVNLMAYNRKKNCWNDHYEDGERMKLVETQNRRNEESTCVESGDVV